MLGREADEEHGRGWSRRRPQLHARLFEQPVALAMVAGRARRHDVFPDRRASARAWDDVIERQAVAARAKIQFI